MTRLVSPAPGDHPGDPVARRHRRRRRVRATLRVLVLLVVAVGLYGLIPRLGGLEEQAAVLRRTDPRLIVAALVAQAGAVTLYVVAFRRVLAGMGAHRPFGTVFHAMMASFFVSHVALGGTAAGFVVSVEALRDADVDRETTSESIAMLALFVAGGIMATFGVGLLLTAGQGLSALAVVAVVVALVLLVGAVTLVVSASRRPDDAERLARGLARRLRLPEAQATQAGAVVRRLGERADRLLTRRALAVTGLVILGEIALDMTSLALFLTAVGHPPPFGPLLLGYAAATVVGLLPLTPSGLGLVEAALIAFAVGYGTPTAAAIPAVLGYRLVNFWLPIPVGLASYVRVSVARRRRA